MSNLTIDGGQPLNTKKFPAWPQFEPETIERAKVGTVGDIGCFSFCQSKHFTTGGEGGAAVTNNEDLHWECKSFRDHGYDVRERLRLLELESKLMYIHRHVAHAERTGTVARRAGGIGATGPRPVPAGRTQGGRVHVADG